MSFRRSQWTGQRRLGWQSSSVRVVAGVVWALLASGCRDRNQEFFGSTAIRNPDAGSSATGGAGGAGGAAGGTGAGGASVGGGSGGGGSAGSCVPSGKETCANLGVDNDCDGDANDVDPDQLLDLANCGACFNLCNQANASNIQCLADPTTGVVGCHYTCLTGFKDLDGDPKNGCECVISSAVELCNQKDDNCNGVVDEGFDLMTDVANCGRCGVTCQFPFAAAACVAGSCTRGACLPGFFDANHNDADGCECQKTNGGVEICDGIDNNCDGQIDEPSALTGAPTCRSLGVCAGVVPTCMGPNGWACVYGADYQAVEDMSKGCDRKDNDCDGQVDEAFQIGQACAVGAGPCAGVGVWACNAAGGRQCNGQMKTPQPEICNGLDDDCDGEVDELNSVADRTTDDKLVYFPAKNVTIFAVEASRYDSTAAAPGVDSTKRPCAVTGRRPWSNVTKEEAAAACARIGAGWRLCTADEWFDACNGSANTVFPYGNTYVPTACVGYDYTAPVPNTAPTTTGAATMCVSDLSAAAGDELYDMSGNVKEWVLTTVAAATYEIRGGAYDIESFTVNGVRGAPGLQCDATTPAPAVDVRLPSVGFRCCLPGQLPAK
jgi:Sulfatase-modifying factor enzyme 1/Putative metal-binding motif